jgi:hypothetical protein
MLLDPTIRTKRWPQARVERSRPNVRGWLLFTTAWMRFTAGVLGPFIFSLDIIVGYAAYARGYLFAWDFAILIFRGLGLTILLLAGASQAKNHAGPILITPALVAIGVLVLDPMSRPYFISFPLAWLWNVAFIGIGIVCIFACAMHVIALNLYRRNRGFVFLREAWNTVRKHHFATLFCIGAMAVAGVSFLAVINQNVGAMQITISPKDYQIQFRFWADYSNSSYLSGGRYQNGTAMLEAMNRSGVVIQNALFGIRDMNNQSYTFSETYSPTDAKNMNDTLGWFAKNYPGIKFEIYAAGMGYNSSGNYEGSIYTPAYIKRVVNVCRDYHPANIVGLYSDWEGGRKYANHTMNDWNQALLTDAFTRVHEYFPNWNLSCCSGTMAYGDFVDDDKDMQYYSRDNIFTPWWTDYGPMIYTCGWPDAPDAGSYSGAYNVYGSAKMLVGGILQGDARRASMWLGITGSQCFNQNYTVQDRNEPIGFGDSKGFANLCREILILKSFGMPAVSIFKASKDSDSKDFFTVYGVDALDRLNATVNGPNSTTPFTIWSYPPYIMGNWGYYTDFLLNFDQLPWMLVGVLYISCGILLAGAGKWKKIARLLVKLRQMI